MIAVIAQNERAAVRNLSVFASKRPLHCAAQKAAGYPGISDTGSEAHIGVKLLQLFRVQITQTVRYQPVLGFFQLLRIAVLHHFQHAVSGILVDCSLYIKIVLQAILQFRHAGLPHLQPLQQPKILH